MNNTYYSFSVLFTGVVLGAFLLECIVVMGGRGIYGLFEEQGDTFAAFATFLAIVAAWKIHRNEINKQDSREERSRERKVLSLRSHMSDALDEIVRYNRECFRTLHMDDVAFPEAPRDALAIFKNSIEYVDDITAASFSEMVSCHQILRARFSSGQNSINDIILYLVEIHQRTIEIFGYARTEETIVNPPEFTRGNMIDALKSLLGYPFPTDPELRLYTRLISDRYTN